MFSRRRANKSRLWLDLALNREVETSSRSDHGFTNNFFIATAKAIVLTLALSGPALSAPPEGTPGPNAAATSQDNAPAPSDGVAGTPPRGDPLAPAEPSAALPLRADADGDGISDILSARLAAAEPGEMFDVIVVFEVPGALARAQAAVGSFPVTREFSIINGFQASMTAAQIRALSATPGVVRIEENAAIGLHDATANDDIGATSARTGFTVTGDGVTICVLDTGINPNHSLFDSKGLTAVEFEDFVNGQSQPYDDHWHGSHVAGIAAGDGTGDGFADDAIGVAPDAALKVGKVVDSNGSGSDAQIIDGVEWCAGSTEPNNADVDVISMSLGGPSTDGSDPVSLAVNCAADPNFSGSCGAPPAGEPKIVVVSAGNSGAVPVTIGAPGVAINAITVGSAAEWSGDPFTNPNYLWQDDGVYLNSFSSRGPVEDGNGNPQPWVKPDIVAIGSQVLSANVDDPSNPSSTAYVVASGTSMSAPQISGVIALMLEADPLLGQWDADGLPHEKVRAILAQTAIDRGGLGPNGDGKDYEYGWGLVDAYAAVAEASGALSYAPTEFPGYTQLSDSVPDNGTWTYEFEVTSGDVGTPVNGVMTIDGVFVCYSEFLGECLTPGWDPDLEMVLEEFSGGSWSQVTADTTGSDEVTLSECPNLGECGYAGRVEINHFYPDEGQYRFRVYPFADSPNNGKGGTFEFEMSMGAAGSGGGNGAPSAGFSVSCNDSTLTCDFTDGSTDSDGSIASWDWDFGDGNTSTAQSPSHTYAAAGSYTVTLTVTDDGGLTDSHSELVTPGTNLQPTADFTFTTSDLTANFADSSSDDDGSIASWDWNFGDGSGSSTQQNPSYSYAVGGTYDVTLTVTDNEGATGSVTQPVTVSEPPPNAPPVASMEVEDGPDPCGGLLDNRCTFNDTSTDSDGTIETWTWDFGSGTLAGCMPCSGPGQSMLVDFPADGPNPTTVSLTVTDDDGATDTASVEVWLSAPANDPPSVTITDPPDGSTYTDGDSVTFSGSASDTEDGDLTASLDWSSDLDGPLGSGGSVTTSSMSVGTHTITASTTDSGGTSGQDTITITIDPVNTAPTVAITAPADGASFNEGDLVSFTGTADDTEDGDIKASLVWTSSLDGQIGTGSGFSTSSLSTGTHTITASVTDSGGLSGDDTITISVNAPPTASFTFTTTDLTVDFIDDSSDGDGSIASWSWDFGDGNGSAAQSPSHTYAAGGTYTVTLTVTDDDGATDSASQSVTVTAPVSNDPPTASFTFTTMDLTVDFTDGSSDSDGSIASWSWDFGDGNGSTAQNPSHTYAAGGTYTVTLTVTDDDGATDSASQSVTVSEPAVLAHIGDLNDASVSQPRNRWDAVVEILIVDDDGSPVPDALVSGDWSNGANGSGSCTTLGNGVCSITKSNLKGNVSPVTFTVTSVSGAFTYDSVSDVETSINLYQPGTSSNEAPTATISAPADGASFDSGSSILFEGSASDTEDGDLTASLDWSSSIDGAFGTGGSVSSLLSDGTHTITASVTDSGGADGTDSITVTVGSTSGLVLESADGYKVQGVHTVDLTWSGGTGSDVEVHRDGVNVQTTPNDGFTTDSTGNKGGGSYNYKICEVGSSPCSGTITVTF